MTNASFIASLKATPRELRYTLLGLLVGCITLILLLPYAILLAFSGALFVSLDSIGKLMGATDVLFSVGSHEIFKVLWFIIALAGLIICLLLIGRSIYSIVIPQPDTPDRILKDFSGIALIFILILGFALFTNFHGNNLLQNLSIILKVFFFLLIYIDNTARFRLLASVAKYYGNNAAPSKLKIINILSLAHAKFNKWEITNTSEPSSQ